MIQTYNLAGQYLLHIYHASRYLEQNNIKCTDVYQPYSIRRIHLTALVSIIFNCMQFTLIPTSNMDSQISEVSVGNGVTGPLASYVHECMQY